MPPHTSLARKRFRQFLLSVALVHALAIAGYYVFGVAGAPERFQQVYAWVWMGATVAVVILGLQRIKRARLRTVVRRPPGASDHPDGH